MNKHYIRPSDWGNNYDPSDACNNDADFAKQGMSPRTFTWRALLLIASFCAVVAICAPSSAFGDVLAPTRTSSFDWQCQDKDGNKLSDHQRFDTALIACLNNPAGDHVTGGTYRINRSLQTPPTPVQLAAPALISTSIAPGTNAGRYDITISWPAVNGAKTYNVERCTGPGCTNFALHGTATTNSYKNTNLPSGFVFRYRVIAAGDLNTLPSAPSAIGEQSTIVQTTSGGTAALSWQAPTQNTDGSPLTDLAGFRIHYGKSSDALVSTVQLDNPALTSYVIDKLDAGTWYFAVTAYTSGGRESALSNIASKTI